MFWLARLLHGALAVVLVGALEICGAQSSPPTAPAPAQLIVELKQVATEQRASAALMLLPPAVLVPLMEQALSEGGALCAEQASESARAAAHSVLASVQEKQPDGSLVIVDARVVRRLELGLSDPSFAVREVCAARAPAVAKHFRERLANAVAFSVASAVAHEPELAEPQLLLTHADALRELATPTAAAKQVLEALLADPSGVHEAYWRRYRESPDADLIDLELWVRDRAILAYLRLTGDVDAALSQRIRLLNETGQHAAVRAIAQVAKQQSVDAPFRDHYGPPLRADVAEWLATQGVRLSADSETFGKVATALVRLSLRDDLPFDALMAPFAPLASSSDPRTAAQARRVLEAGRLRALRKK